MNEIVNKLLLAGDNEMHLRQSVLTCFLTISKQKRMQTFKERGNSRYIYQNELYKTCFHYVMSSGGFKDLPRRTASDKILRHKAFNISENPKYDGYQHGIASMVYKFFDKKLSGIKNENISSKELAEELHKPIIRQFKKQIN